jgi:Anti-sigma-K factor rskA
MASTRVQLVALEPPDDFLEATPGAPVPFSALELPPARRPGWPTLAALAVACGIVAIGLGAWALVAETRSTSEAAVGGTDARSLAVLTDRGAERYPLRGSRGRITLVVSERGDAVLALDGLGAPPKGSSYAAWLVPVGSAVPLAAGAFDASARAVPLTRPVPPGARVGVTLEPASGADRPSRTLRLVAVRARG